MLGFDLPTLAWIAAASLVAFIVRGLTGFGSSMIGIGAMTIVLPPAQVVPAFLAVELLTATHLLPGVWKLIDWRSLRWVIAGCALSTPVGVALLGGIDADPMRLVVSGCLLMVAAFMLTQTSARLSARASPGALGAFVVGCGAGVLNGAAGIGGPPAVVFYFATRTSAIGRASLIAFFVFTDLYALAWAGAGGLLHAAAWKLIVVSLPFALAGIYMGSRLYLQLEEPALRRLVWRLLVALGVLGVASAAWRLAG